MRKVPKGKRQIAKRDLFYISVGFFSGGEHGRRKRGARLPWIFKCLAKKGCFLSFEWEKSNFTTFGPLDKFRKSPLVAPPGKNSSDAHGGKVSGAIGGLSQWEKT